MAPPSTTTETWFWSPSRTAFYDGALKPVYDKAETWPADAVEVGADIYAAANPTPYDGKMLGVDAAGNPARVAVPPPPQLPVRAP